MGMLIFQSLMVVFFMADSTMSNQELDGGKAWE